jgi:hypothetical protein
VLTPARDYGRELPLAALVERGCHGRRREGVEHATRAPVLTACNNLIDALSPTDRIEEAKNLADAVKELNGEAGVVAGFTADSVWEGARFMNAIWRQGCFND